MKKMAVISLLAVLALVLAPGIGIAAESVTLRGHVTDDNQLMTEEGEFYDIVETQEGLQVLEKVGEKIEVRGTLVEREDVKEILVKKFTVLK